MSINGRASVLMEGLLQTKLNHDDDLGHSRKRHAALVAVIIVALLVLHSAAAAWIYRAGFSISATPPITYLVIGGLAVLAIFKVNHLRGLRRSKATARARRNYLPAAGVDWLLPFYDGMAKMMGGDEARRALLDQARVKDGHRILDIGCGTGSLLVELKNRYPETDAVGLDPDPKALARAGRKAARSGISIRLDQGFGDALPYPEASFDRVLSSLMFHHLPADQQEETLRAVRRVLKPGGEFHMVDFEGHGGHAHGFLSRLLHSSDRLKNNTESRILSLMTEAGFVDPRTVDRKAMRFGNIAYYRAIA